MRPGRRVAATWPAGDGAARAAHGRDNSVRRRRGPGEDHPGRRTATAGASCDRDEQVTVPQPWKRNGSPPVGLTPVPPAGRSGNRSQNAFRNDRRSRSRYGSHPGPGARTWFPPVGPGHDQWPRQKNGLRGGLPSPVLPGSGPGGRRSASELSPASQPFLPAPGLPGIPFGPAPSITSQTIFTLHGAHDGRLGPKAPACTGQTSWLRRKLRQRSGPVPGARYGDPFPRPGAVPDPQGQLGRRGPADGPGSPRKPQRQDPQAATPARAQRARRRHVCPASPGRLT